MNNRKYTIFKKHLHSSKSFFFYWLLIFLIELKELYQLKNIYIITMIIGVSKKNEKKQTILLTLHILIYNFLIHLDIFRL